MHPATNINSSSSSNSGRWLDDECHEVRASGYNTSAIFVSGCATHVVAVGRPFQNLAGDASGPSSTRGRSRAPRQAATGARAAHNRRPPAIGIIFLIIGASGSPPHRRTPRTLLHPLLRGRLARVLHRPAGSHDPEERTCSQCKMSARAAGSRRP